MTETRILPCKRVKDYRPVVEQFYSLESSEFFTKHHKAGMNKDVAVMQTIEAISAGAEFFTIEWQGRTAAFFVRTKIDFLQVLEGFHIKPNFRNPYFLNLFWNTVKSKFDGDIATGIYEGNEPAIRHLLLNGFVRVGETRYEDKVFALLIFNQA